MVRSVVNSLAVTMEEAEKEYHIFITRKLKGYGSLPVQHLCGHLSSMHPTVRNTIGSSPSALTTFLKRYPGDFKIDLKGNVSLIYKEPNYSRTRDSSLSSRSSDSYPPDPPASDIPEGKGKIIQLTAVFGFLRAFEPKCTTVYFSLQNFDNVSVATLEDYGVKVGQILGFSAVKGPDGCPARFRATKVWRVKDDDLDYELDDTFDELDSYSNRSTTYYNKCNSKNIQKSNSIPNQKNVQKPTIKKLKKTLETVGYIQNVFDKYGFISANGNSKSTVYFGLKDVQDYKNLSDLRTVFRKGDFVEFKAVPSQKNMRVPWQATAVFDRRDIATKIHETQNLSPNAGASSSNQEHNSLKKTKSTTDLINSLNSACSKYARSTERPLEPQLPLEHSNILDMVGKLYPKSDNTATIKYNNEEIHADLDNCHFFIRGSPVSDLSWEFFDGESVHFSCKKGKGSCYRAFLVWTGVKPDISQLAEAETIQTNENTVSDEVETVSKSGASADSVNESSDDTSVMMVKHTPKYSNWGDSPYPAELGGNYEEENTKNEEKMKENSNLPADSMEYSTHQPKCLSQESVVSGNPHSACNNISSEENSEEEIFESDTDDDMGICVVENEESYKSKDKLSAERTELAPPNKPIIQNVEASALPSTQNVRCTAEDVCMVQVPNISNVCRAQDASATNMPSNPSAQNMLDEQNEPTKDKKEPCVDMFEDITGHISKIYRIIGQITSDKLRKPIDFLWNDLYEDGELAREKYDLTHIKEILKVGNIVNFNCFEVVDDLGHLWQKVTLVWIGEKPHGAKEIEPNDYIIQQDLHVSCPIPTRASFRQRNKNRVKLNSPTSTENQSMRLLNQVNTDVDIGDIVSPINGQISLNKRNEHAVKTSDVEKSGIDTNNNSGYVLKPSISQGNSDAVALCATKVSNILHARLDQAKTICKDHRTLQVLNMFAGDIDFATDMIRSCFNEIMGNPATSTDANEASNATSVNRQSKDSLYAQMDSQYSSESADMQTQTFITGEVSFKSVYPC